VVAASAKQATVLLITDPTFSVGVGVGNNRQVGVANGTGRNNPLRVDLVPLNTKLNQGDVLLTSGLQLERFPKDIPVGKIATVKQAPGALQEDLTMTTVEDMSRLEFVQVLQWSPQTP